MKEKGVKILPNISKILESSPAPQETTWVLLCQTQKEKNSFFFHNCWIKPLRSWSLITVAIPTLASAASVAKVVLP